MKNWKKLLVLLLALVTVFAFAACGDKENEETEPTLNPGDENCEHVFTEWEVTKERSCTKKGLKTRECEKCGREEEEVLLAYGHSYYGGECSECGREAKECEHPEVDIVVMSEATCTESGEERKVCKICKAAVEINRISALRHPETTEVVISEATCTEDGEIHHICNLCGEVADIDYIWATWHSDTTVKVISEPTCTENGLSQEICNICGEVVDEDTIWSNGHSYEYIDAKNPTCTENGWYKYRKCTVCDYLYNYEERPATGHSFSQGTCSQCGVVDPESEIRTVEDLKKLNNSDSYFTLKNDIDLSGIEWTPIVGFSGTLEGNNHTIKNLTINADADNVGFFSTLSGTVKNLSLTNAKIVVTGRHENIGILCGTLTGLVENITTGGSVTAEMGTRVGGVAGYMKRTGSYTLSTLENKASVSGMECVGGIFGELINKVDSYSTFSISLKSFTNSGNVVSSGNYASGIVGKLHVENTYSGSKNTPVYIESFANTGSVQGVQYVGGMFGYAYSDDTSSSVQSCSNSSSVTAECYVGAIAGQLSNISVNSCTNDGSSVIATDYLAVEGVKYAYVGGFVGRGYFASNCTNTATITYTGGGRYVGGIMGCASGWGSSDMVMNNLKNTVDISGAEYVGGIIGYCAISGTYSMTNIENSGNISGTGYIGGVIGALQDKTDNYDAYTVNLSALKNSGTVTASADYAGGIMATLNAENVYSSSKNTVLYVSDFTNTGDVTGALYVGGMFGYAYSDDAKSRVQGCSNSSVITAKCCVGAIGGYLSNITIDSCTNDGSSIIATDYISTDGVKYAYVGGFIGRGYFASNCTNTATITYTGGGLYVGGIMGCASGWGGSNMVMDNLKNTVDISGAECVGGIIGYCAIKGSYSMTNMENTGNISGNGYIGGIVGALTDKTNEYDNYSVNLSALKNSGTITASADYAGGVAGRLYVENTYSGSKNTVLYVSDFVNTGDVTGAQYVGGIAGYAYSDTSNSYFQDCSNASAIVAQCYVGTIVGKTSKVCIDSCTNDGSTLTATGYEIVDNVKYAYVGGFVGYGYLVNNCTNTVAIDYKSDGRYVGGIAGYINTSGSYSMNSLTNTANISGADYVGGIFGGLRNATDSYDDYAVNLTDFSNSGNIRGTGEYVGGIIGYLYAVNSYSSSRITSVYATKMTNTGSVSGKRYVGGIFGYAKTDSGKSSVIDVVATGAVSGSSDFGKQYGYVENIQFQ